MTNINKKAATSAVSSNARAVAVCALYKFVTLDDFESLQPAILTKLNEHSIRGTLLLATEGINGTIAGTETDLNTFLQWLRCDQRFTDIDCKISYHESPPFHRTKVKLKREIVTMGIDGIDPNNVVGTYVDPAEWNNLIRDPEVLLIDTRNEYEYGIGSFEGAVNPHTNTFREFPKYVEQNLNPDRHRKVAMFCTGGIRCEKASAYMKEQGFEQVFHLKGGILKYLEDVDQSNSMWNGECFVFDDRVAVNHTLDKGQYDQCHACRYPITEQDKLTEEYVPGVSCPRCHATLTEQQRARFAEREKQVQIAKQRGATHIGSDSRRVAQINRQAKEAEKQRQRRTSSEK